MNSGKIISSAQMRAIESAAIARGEATGAGLMQRAGAAVVAALLGHWPELAQGARHALVLCGPGNNGGDGYVIARLLAGRGWRVTVRALGDAGRLPADARAMRDLWVQGGGAVLPLAQGGPGADAPDLLVDALFGTGLARPFDAAAVVPQAGRIVAVDVPSGLDADTGAVRCSAVAAHLTVTFHRAKTGHNLGQGPDLCGALVVADLGLAETDDGVPLLAAPAAARLAKAGTGHKFTHGHALVLAGGAGQGGAARLAARGSLRIGAGLVTLGCPPEALAENAARLDAVMLRPLADGAALASLLGDRRITALCLGPGLGTGLREAGLVAAALRHGCGTVLDADALTLLAQAPGLLAALHGGCVLTPHEGEFARLFPDLAAQMADPQADPKPGAPARTQPAYTKIDAAREAAARAGCTVVLKGADTVIADAAGRCALQSAHRDRAAPWLATAGSGDVLAGLITGALARGFAPFDAACTGAWLHLEAALDFGPGLIAEDLPDRLPAVLRRLGL